VVYKDLQTIHTSAVVIITRPPEIIVCLKLDIHNRDVFVIFDSHSRPSHPDGAGFILNTLIHHTATRLNEILPVDSHLMDDGDLQWQAQLLANYLGHIFVSRDLDNGHAHLKQTIIESSLAILALHAEVLDLRTQNSTLTSDTKRLEADMEKMEDDHCEELKRILQSSRNHDFDSYWTSSVSAKSSNKAGLRVTLHHSDMSNRSSQRIDGNSWSSASSSNTRCLPNPNDDSVLAEQMQFECLDSDRHNAEAAAQRQQQFDEEDRYLRTQMEELTNNKQRQF
jgi:hypothetical protein